MLPKSARPTTKSVHYLLRRGKRRHGNYLTITRVTGQRRSRRGVHIAKKVARYAVQRNTARRAVFAVIEREAGQVSDGLFFITVNKKNAHLRADIINAKTDITLYNRIEKAVEVDIQRFVQRYEKKKI